jgi:neutral ceramidase
LSRRSGRIALLTTAPFSAAAPVVGVRTPYRGHAPAVRASGPQPMPEYHSATVAIDTTPAGASIAGAHTRHAAHAPAGDASAPGLERPPSGLPRAGIRSFAAGVMGRRYDGGGRAGATARSGRSAARAGTLLFAAAAAALTAGCAQAGSGAQAAADGLLLVGLATADITPDEPMRLAGYAGRETPVAEVLQPLRATAIAFGGDGEQPSVLVTLDLIGVPATLTEEVAERLQSEGVGRARLVVAATHTHSAPELTGVLPTHITAPRAPEEEATIDRYTNVLVDRVEEVARAALADRRPARLAWGQGSAGFAANRRVLREGKWAAWGIQPDGAVDHDLPVMRIAEPDGGLRAVLLGYACHATTFDGEAIHGDWPAAARDSIEARHPGSTALVLIGAGADANPNPRRSAEAVAAHALEVANEVDRVLAGPMRSIADPPVAALESISLRFHEIPSKEVLEATAAGTDRQAITATYLLSRIAAGEDLGSVDYPLQRWSFGDSLSMVFLAGEVVADYSLRLKREVPGDRLWVTAYTGASPFYVASERMIAEGGYEVDESMLSYGHPSRLADGTEDRIIAAVHALLRDAP